MSRNIKLLFIIVAVIIIIAGIFHAISLIFINDDAFITFRYVDNLTRGNGPVYNAGERVEGYTNFFWLTLLALCSTLYANADPVLLSKILGIIFFSATLILFIISNLKLKSEKNNFVYLLPITSIALALHRDFCAYATSGLETSMFTFFVSCSFLLLIAHKSERVLLLSGLLIVLTMLTRPDGFLFFVSACIFILIKYKKPSIPLILFSLPTILLFLPYWIWRYNYYGYFFPNTFYAKSINIPYYSQGLNYIFIYFKVYYVFIIVIFIEIIFIGKVLKIFTNRRGELNFLDYLREDKIIPSYILLAGMFVLLYFLFIIYIGGDFMHARFLIPVTPLLYFLGEHIAKIILKPRWYIVTAAVIVITTIFRNDIYKNNLNVGYIVDEVRFYTEEQHKRAMHQGKSLNRYLKDLPVRMAFGPAFQKVAYYSDVPYALETSTGLTDTFIAHQKLITRGRPGHEKPAPMEYMIKRKIHFYIGPRLMLPKDEFPLNAIMFDSVLAQIITYDESLMVKLRKYPEIKFIHIPSYLDEYKKNIDQYPKEKILRDYNFLENFYFSHNNDTIRQAIFKKYLK